MRRLKAMTSKPISSFRLENRITAQIGFSYCSTSWLHTKRPQETFRCRHTTLGSSCDRVLLWNPFVMSRLGTIDPSRSTPSNREVAFVALTRLDCRRHQSQFSQEYRICDTWRLKATRAQTHPVSSPYDLIQFSNLTIKLYRFKLLQNRLSKMFHRQEFVFCRVL